MQMLNERLHDHRAQHGTKLVYSTGRSLTSYQQLMAEKSLLPPDALITGVGTAIHYDNDYQADDRWSAILSQGWNRDQAMTIASAFADLVPQPDTEQSDFKVSFFLSEDVAVDVLSQLEERLTEAEIQFNLIYSGGQDLDILPKAANKGSAMMFLQEQWQFESDRTVVCGDSGNDLALFSYGDNRGVIVGNARPELLQWHHANPAPHRYLAQANCAGGILEGLKYFGFLPTH